MRVEIRTCMTTPQSILQILFSYSTKHVTCYGSDPDSVSLFFSALSTKVFLVSLTHLCTEEARKTKSDM